MLWLFLAVALLGVPHTPAGTTESSTHLQTMGSHSRATVRNHTESATTHSKMDINTNATKSPSKVNVQATSCFTCSDPFHCTPLSCPKDKNYCLQQRGILALAGSPAVAWRNGSCVAWEDCPANTTWALNYNVQYGFWANATCCHGNCKAPELLEELPAPPFRNRFLCPTCEAGSSQACNASLYMQCPYGETECVQMDLVSRKDNRTVSVRGCGSLDLCKVGRQPLLLPGLSGFHVARQPFCSVSLRAVMGTKCRSAASHAFSLALPTLLLALGTALA